MLEPLLVPKMVAGASAGSAGVAGGVWAFYENGRIKIGLSGKAAELIGLEGAVGVSFGVLEGRSFGDYWDEPVEIDPAVAELLIETVKDYYASLLLATVPNTVASGCPTVTIGG